MIHNPSSQFQALQEYGDIFQAILQLDEKLQKGVSSNQKNSINDVYSVIEKAYWKLYLQQNEQNLTEQQIKQIQFYLTSKIGKSLDSQLSKTSLQNNKVPKWFLYKGYSKKDNKENQFGQQINTHRNDRHASQSIGLKNQGSLKTEDGTYVDPYHLNIKLQAQNGLPQLQIIYRFFNINKMLEKSVDLMDIEKITVLYRKGNGFDRENPDQVQEHKRKFKKKFKMYAELVRIFEDHGYGARIAKKHSRLKEKITGVLYQYAVVHISKITFKLLQKYVMNFINKKTKYTHRSKVQKITYNMFNLPTFFTPQIKITFIKLMKIIFHVTTPLPEITKQQLQELYNYLLKMIDEKEKNPDKFKNEYMVKLENPTFYNVKKEFRGKLQQEAQERKRLGIKNKGRRSKMAESLNYVKKSIAEEKQFLSKSKLEVKGESLVSSKKQYKQHKEYRIKKQHHKNTKNQYHSDSQQEQFDNEYDSASQDQLVVYNEGDYDLDEEIGLFDSDQESQDIKDYFRKSSTTKKNNKNKDKQKKKKKKHKKQHKSKEKRQKQSGEIFDYD